MDRNALKSRPRRRSYTQQFKAEMVAECLQGEVSLASLAVDHGMNPNVLRRWVMEHERYGKHALQDSDVSPAERTVDMAPANWIPVKAAQVADDREVVTATAVAQAPARAQARETIELELAARGLIMTVRWPASEHKALAHWTRELLT